MPSIKHPENKEKRMKKFQNFKWQMWHVHLIGIVVFFLSIFICGFWYKSYEEKLALKENYIRVGQKQGIVEIDYIESAPSVSVTLERPLDKDDYDSIDIGRHYIVFQESRTRKDDAYIKDQYEYFKIHYYLFDHKEIKKETMDLLKIAYEQGFVGLSDRIELYSDGKDDYVRVWTREKQMLYINLRTQKPSRTGPTEKFEWVFKDDNTGKDTITWVKREEK